MLQYIIKNWNPLIMNSYADLNYFLLENTIYLSIPLKTIYQLEDEVLHVFNAIQQAAWKSTPIMYKKLIVLNFPKKIRKRKLRRRWQ